MMRITSTDLKHWADTIESKNLLPLLIRKLVIASSSQKDILSIHFPAGDDVFVGGYDGVLETARGTAHIPDGQSVWEFGVTENKRKKADEDYEKRTSHSLGKTMSVNTYVAVTLKKYRDKEKWAKQKTEEGKWKDVRFYDAVDIEHWLELAPTVEIWLKRHLGWPVNGVSSLEDYWNQWSTNHELQLSGFLFLASRENQQQKLISLIYKEEGHVEFIQSNSSEESLAFILTSIQSDENQGERLQLKTLVVSNKESFDQLIESTSKMIFVPKFTPNDTQLAKAQHKGHKVFVPVSNSHTSSQSNVLELPIVNREGFINGLTLMGIDRERAALFSKNTGRDLSILRRSLEFTSSKPAWVDSIDKNIFIPFLLLSRLDFGVEGDIEILEEISLNSANSCERYLREILQNDESPVYNIGSKWRLISHHDTWLYLSQSITKEDLEKFEKIALTVLSETNPKFNLDPEKRHLSGLYNSAPKYSRYLKKGISETLVVISVLSEKFKLESIENPQMYVNGIISKVIGLADENNLRSLGNNLSLLAEAAPLSFLNEIEKSIKDERSLGFFEEEKSLFGSTNNLPNLLWALEALAWMPEYLVSVTRLLCNLIEQQPEELPTANTPFNTLKGIFRLWYPQTNTSASERKQVLEVLRKGFPDIAFELFSSFVSKGDSTAFHNQKMRWRMFAETRSVKVTNQEFFESYAYATECLIDLMEASKPSRILVMIKKLDSISRDKVPDVLDRIKGFEHSTEDLKHSIFHSFRELIGKHRTYYKQDWALTRDILSQVEEVAKLFNPKDYVEANSYLFESHHPHLMKGRPDELKGDYKKMDKHYLKLRTDFVSKVLKDYGVQKIIELTDRVENPDLYGQALANNSLTSDQIDELIGLLKCEDKKKKWLLRCYLWQLKQEDSLQLFEKTSAKATYSNSELADFLLMLRSNIDLFNYVEELSYEIKSEYWSRHTSLIPSDKEAVLLAIKRYIEHKRSFSVLNMLGYSHKDMNFTTKYLTDTLMSLDLSEFNEPVNYRLETYDAQLIFGELQKRSDIDDDICAKLEYKYLFVFDSLGSGVQPKYLHKAIASKPDWFVDLITDKYLAESDERREEEVKAIDPKIKAQFGERAYKVLNNFNVIPGLQDDGSIDVIKLKAWISEVLALGKGNDRIRSTNSEIGKLLAKHPNGVNGSFPVEVYDILEEQNDKSMFQGFSSQIFNSLGFSSRPAGSGGYIEREKEERFKNMANEIKMTHPRVSSLFRVLAEGYKIDAKSMDASALLDNLEG